MSITRKGGYYRVPVTLNRQIFEICYKGRVWEFECTPSQVKNKIIWKIAVIYYSKFNNRICGGTYHRRGPITLKICAQILMKNEQVAIHDKEL